MNKNLITRVLAVALFAYAGISNGVASEDSIQQNSQEQINGLNTTNQELVIQTSGLNEDYQSSIQDAAFLNQRIQELEQSNKLKDQRISELEKKLQGQVDNSQNLDEGNQGIDQSTYTNRLLKQIKDKETMIDSLKEQMTNYNIHSNDLIKALRQRDDKIRELKEAMEEPAVKVHKLQQELTSRDKRITQLTESLNQSYTYNDSEIQCKLNNMEQEILSLKEALEAFIGKK